MVKIAYDAGHGKNTPGKRSPNDEREWTFNNAVVTAFERELSKYKNVELLRTDDKTGVTDVPLATRTNAANTWKADCYISFHHNALKDDGIYRTHTGVETFVYSLKNDVESVKLAKVLHPEVVKAYGLRDRGIKEANLHICRETKMPAILIEGGFMDSSIDITKLRSNAVLTNCGVYVAQELAKYLGLALKDEVKPPTVSKVDDSPSSWAKEAWEKATKAKVVDGTRPKSAITREEVIVILDRLNLIK